MSVISHTARLYLLVSSVMQPRREGRRQGFGCTCSVQMAACRQHRREGGGRGRGKVRRDEISGMGWDGMMRAGVSHVLTRKSKSGSGMRSKRGVLVWRAG